MNMTMGLDLGANPLGAGRDITTALPDAPVITTASLDDATDGVAYSFQLAATGTDLVWEHVGGTLPTGIVFDAATHTLSGTHSGTGTFGGLVFRVTDAWKRTNEATLSLDVASALPWYDELVADIESTASATCTHAVFVEADTTTKNVGGDPAADGDRIYKLFDRKAGGYDYIEGASNKGGVYRAASVGTRAAMELLRTNSEYVKTVKNANAATPNLIPAGDHTVIVVGKFSDNNVNSATARFNPLIWGSSDMSGAAAAAPSLLLRDDTTNRIHGYDAGGSLVQVASTPAPYDTPLVLTLRNKREPSGVAVVGSNKTYNSLDADADITSLAKLFHIGFGADYLSGHVAAVIVLDGYVDDTTMDSITDLVNTAFGL